MQKAEELSIQVWQLKARYSRYGAGVDWEALVVKVTSLNSNPNLDSCHGWFIDYTASRPGEVSNRIDHFGAITSFELDQEARAVRLVKTYPGSVADVCSHTLSWDSFQEKYLGMWNNGSTCGYSEVSQLKLLFSFVGRSEQAQKSLEGILPPRV